MAPEPGLALGPAEPADAAFLRELWRTEWGGETMELDGRTLALTHCQAHIARRAGRPVGAATYVVEGRRAELVSLNALTTRQGIGRALVAAVAQAAAAAGARRLELTTTNDNVAALAFYQRVGFCLAELRLGAVDAARHRKPTIPVAGEGGVALRDEWRLVAQLEDGPPAPGLVAGTWRPRAGVVAIADDRLLLIERRRARAHDHVLPGGGVRAGESALAAACRAALEETGVEVLPRREICQVWVGGRLERYFEGQAAGRALAGGGSAERRPVWVHRADLPALDLRPRTMARALAALAPPPAGPGA